MREEERPDPGVLLSVDSTSNLTADAMSIIKLFGPAIVAAAIVTPALAQAVISEPGYCAFFYPTANCQNEGPGNPYTDPNWRRDGGGWSANQVSNSTVGVVRKRGAQAPVAILRARAQSRY